jgi:hypothetical protein
MKCFDCPVYVQPSGPAAKVRVQCCDETNAEAADRLFLTEPEFEAIKAAFPEPAPVGAHRQMIQALRPPLAPTAPKIGQTVRIEGRVGEVCAPDDPRRSGTYTSSKYGEIPVRWLGSRAERRKKAAEARKAR